MSAYLMRRNVVILGGRAAVRHSVSFEIDLQARAERLDAEQTVPALHRTVMAPITSGCSHVGPTVEWRRGEGL